MSCLTNAGRLPIIQALIVPACSAGACGPFDTQKNRPPPSNPANRRLHKVNARTVEATKTHRDLLCHTVDAGWWKDKNHPGQESRPLAPGRGKSAPATQGAKAAPVPALPTRPRSPGRIHHHGKGSSALSDTSGLLFLNKGNMSQPPSNLPAAFPVWVRRNLLLSLRL